MRWCAELRVCARAGSGKTFTMQPLPLRAAADMFSLLADPQFADMALWVSCFEIYGGKLYDLLNGCARPPWSQALMARGETCAAACVLQSAGHAHMGLGHKGCSGAVWRGSNIHRAGLTWPGRRARLEMREDGRKRVCIVGLKEVHPLPAECPCPQTSALLPTPNSVICSWLLTADSACDAQIGIHRHSALHATWPATCAG